MVIRQTQAGLVLATLSLGGCGECKCDEPNGPAVDLVAALPDVRRVFEVDFHGMVRDGPVLGTYSSDTPCALAGAPFDGSSDVGDVSNCDDYRGEDPEGTDDCTSARSGHYPMQGRFSVDGGEPYVLSGQIVIWSGEGGLFPFEVDLGLSPVEFPLQTLDVATGGHNLDDLEFLGMTWGRRLSEDDSAEAVWEVCGLVFD